MMMSNNWIEVLILAKNVTEVADSLLFLALKSLNAPTQNSLAKIKHPIKPVNSLSRTNVIAKMGKRIKILSATGSNTAPSSDTKPYLRAKYPSKKSVIAAKMKRTRLIPYKFNIATRKKIIGDAIIRNSVRNKIRFFIN